MEKGIIRIFTLLILWATQMGTAIGVEKADLYTDKGRGFSIEVPQGWEVAAQSQGTLAVAFTKRTPLKPFSPGIIVSILEDTLTMPETKSELELIVKQISSPSQQIANIENFKVVKSDIDQRKGSQAFFYKASYDLKRTNNPKDGKIMTLNYVFKEKSRDLALTLVAPAKEYKAYEKVFYQALDSLTLSLLDKEKK